MTILIRANSHRAAKKMEGMIGPQPCFYSFDRYATGGFYKLSEDDYEKVKNITGISKAKDGDDIKLCWETGKARP